MAAPEDGGVSKHGIPTGIRFVPEDLELLGILEDKLRGRPLGRLLDAIFHEVRILDFHPAKLYEFHGTKKWKPVRAAQGGRWKAFGACKTVQDGGIVVGRKLAIEFYGRRFDGDNNPVRTNWGMHEFARIIGPQNKLADVAVYRLYKRNGEENPGDLGAGAAESMNRRAQGSAAAMALPPPTPGLPAGTMIFMANVASTSQACAPQSSMSQLQQEWHQNSYGAEAAPPSAPAPGQQLLPEGNAVADGSNMWWNTPAMLDAIPGGVERDQLLQESPGAQLDATMPPQRLFRRCR
ncbi:hypothetical protein E2562_017979 [Oryza meyeriana var. granulata]|uniref:NAC domain-containing protein n=1 Tax=Oryza meyeriana var. granulata TaxID=110450 RepID=A0A6G1F8W7_9ORYZ|nr:hypothetical protein E2562_017979 [Oryza meyeriana var. granulata]